MRLTIIGLLVITSFFGRSQVDSLASVLSRTHGIDRVPILNELSWQLSFENGPQALVYAKEALGLASALGDKEGTATSFARIGLVYDYEGRYKRALDSYQKSLDLRIVIGDSTPIGNAWNNLGAVHQMTGNYQDAISAHLEALKIREGILERSSSNENLKLVAQSLNNIAIIHRVMKRTNKAIKSYERSLEIKREVKDYAGVIITLSNLAVAYQSKGNSEAALNFYLDAYRLAEKQNLISEIGHCLNNMGLTYISLENYTEAENKFNSALKLAYQHNERHQIATSYINLAKLYHIKGDFMQSVEFATNGLHLADSINFQEGIKKSLHQLTASHESMGHFALALQFHKKYTSIKDSLLNKTNSDKILELSARYDAEWNESKIDRLTAQSNFDQSELERRSALSTALFISFLLVLTISFFVIRNTRTKKLLAEEKAEEEIIRHLKEIDLLRANIQNQLHQADKFVVGIPKGELNMYLLNPLSERELEVMFLLADGKSNKIISEELFVSINTIKTHVLKIYEKLDVNNRTQAAVKAGTMNILEN